MSQPERKAGAPALEPHRIGSVQVTLTPHHIENIGPRVIVGLREGFAYYPLNITADEARLLASYLRIAACEAESLERRAKRQHENRYSTAVSHAEACWRRIASHVGHCEACRIKLVPTGGLDFEPGCETGRALKDERRIALERRAQVAR
jgi:hypothetical protein